MWVLGYSSRYLLSMVAFGFYTYFKNQDAASKTLAEVTALPKYNMLPADSSRV